jgi:hypothetical protein
MPWSNPFSFGCQDCDVAISTMADYETGEVVIEGGREPNLAAILGARRSCQRLVEALASVGPGGLSGDRSPSVAKRSSLWPKA